MSRWIGMISMIVFVVSLQAQEASFEVVAADSVGVEGFFEISFKLKNGSGKDFQAPDLSEQFEVVNGPNMSSSMRFVNGEMSQSLSYTYYLKAKELGTFVIEPATIIVNGEVLESQWKKVVVAENIKNRKKEGRSFFGEFGFPEMGTMPRLEMPKPDLEIEGEKKQKGKKKRKKKRKTYKI